MVRGNDRSRELILRRIEEAVGFSLPTPLPAGPAVQRDWDIEARFIEEFTRAGGVIYRAGSAEEAGKILQEIAREVGAVRAARWGSPLLDLLQVDAVLAAVGVNIVSLPADDRELYGKELDSVHMGITEAEHAIAETGTIVLLADPGRPRAVSLLPRVHVAVLPREALLPTFEDLFPRLASRGIPPSAVTFITGPSRTADIEMTPVMGVHGPQAVYIILLESSPSSQAR